MTGPDGTDPAMPFRQQITVMNLVLEMRQAGAAARKFCRYAESILAVAGPAPVKLDAEVTKLADAAAWLQRTTAAIARYAELGEPELDHELRQLGER
jgi:hypothetical protein